MKANRLFAIVNSVIIGCLLLFGTVIPGSVFAVSDNSDGSAQITFTYNIIDDHVVITGMDRDTLPEDGTLAIPAEIEGRPVTMLGMQAFTNNKDIKKLIIPGSVQDISHYCFNGCSGITEIELADGLTTLGEMAFRGCSFSTIALPSSVTSIGYGCFSMCNKLEFMKIPPGVSAVPDNMLQYCSSLEYIEIPAGVESIGNGAFEQCGGLHAIYVNSDNKNYVSKDGILFTADMKTLMVYPCAKNGESYSVPEGVTIIAAHAFHGSQLSEVSIPASVLSVGDFCFCNCGKLGKVRLAEGLKNIGNSAFSMCGSLEGIAIPGTVQVIGETAFFASGLQSITIPASVIEIKNQTFFACNSLKSAVISEGVLKIGSGAFQACSVLRSAVVPDSVTDIGQNAFADAGASLEEDKSFVIVCSENSAAAAYASDNGIERSDTAPEDPDEGKSDDPSDGGQTDKKSDGQNKPGAEKLKAPKLKVKNKRGHKVKITWSKVAGASGYQIYIKCPGEKKFHKRAVRSSKVKSITHKKLLRNRRYYYKVRAFKKSGKKKIYGKWSKVRSVKIKR